MQGRGMPSFQLTGDQPGPFVIIPFEWLFQIIKRGAAL